MFVVATAGHVDHGKSTLVRLLTGMEPDRWAEERRRGLTIDLGFAWTVLPSGRQVAFVDVPGHRRFVGNMLAGLGPAPVVMFVVAADQGWQAQSGEHRDAVAALGINSGILVLSRADRAPHQVPQVLAQARAALTGTGLADAPAVAVSAVTGAGLDTLRSTLDAVLGDQPVPAAAGRVRLWVDRSFSVTGAGTVVTGTLTSGEIAQGDRLEIMGRTGRRTVIVRGIETLGRAEQAVRPVSRVALNLRGVATTQIRRGDAAVTPHAWRLSQLIDVRRVSGLPFDHTPAQLSVHLGTAAITAHLRPFGSDHARLALDRELPLVVGDRLILRDPGTSVVGGAQVLDADPPRLRRRGDAARRAVVLAGLSPQGDLAAEVARRGVVSEKHLRELGLLEGRSSVSTPDGVTISDGWWLSDARCGEWAGQLRNLVDELRRRDPLAPGLSRGAAKDRLGLPADFLIDVIVHRAGLLSDRGYIRSPDLTSDLGEAEDAVRELERRMTAQPFHAPEAEDLARLGLGQRELAAAERAGRLLRLRDGVVLLPNAPDLAVRVLTGLTPPFTTSQARQALGTTRRVAIPLLEHLDARGRTLRHDAGHREIVSRHDPLT